jgi:hypothetical protein
MIYNKLISARVGTMSKMKIATALLGGLLISAYAGGAQASVVYSDFDPYNGASSAVIDNFNVTTSPGGVFAQKANAGSLGVGVSEGAVPGEIDGAGASAEFIRFESISGSRLLSAFTVSFLYAAPAFGDTVNESASIIIDGFTYVLSVVDTLNASFSFGPGATVTNLSPGSAAGGGEWQVAFANPLSFASIQFSPGPTAGSTAPQADYAFGSLTTAAVPGPIVGAGLPGLMMALGGLVILARRRRNQAV